jgi:hypothetical protein
MSYGLIFFGFCWEEMKNAACWIALLLIDHLSGNGYNGTLVIAGDGESRVS